MPTPLVALPRKVRRRVAIHATWVPQHRRDLAKSFLRSRSIILARRRPRGGGCSSRGGGMRETRAGERHDRRERGDRTTDPEKNSVFHTSDLIVSVSVSDR